jgi:hypothetical protein
VFWHVFVEQWVLNAIFHSIILFLITITLFILPGAEPDGSTSGLWLGGAGVNLVLVLVVNLKVCESPPCVSLPAWNICRQSSAAYQPLVFSRC